MKFIKVSKIVKKDDKYQVQSEKGRNLGTYDSKSKAEERLKQVEMFKHMKKKSSYDDNFTFEFDLARKGVIEISPVLLDELVKSNPKTSKIFQIDPEAEIWNEKWQGNITWTTDFNLNNQGIEWMFIQAKPANILLTITMSYFKNEEDKENSDTTEETFEIPLELKKITVQADNPFIRTSLYPLVLEINSATTATLVFDD